MAGQTVLCNPICSVAPRMESYNANPLQSRAELDPRKKGSVMQRWAAQKAKSVVRMLMAAENFVVLTKIAHAQRRFLERGGIVSASRGDEGEDPNPKVKKAGKGVKGVKGVKGEANQRDQRDQSQRGQNQRDPRRITGITSPMQSPHFRLVLHWWHQA